MELSKTAKKAIEKTPWLKKCLDEYFAPGQMLFDERHLVGIKWRSDGCYAVLLFKVGDYFYVADVAGVNRSVLHDGAVYYSVCNDGEDVTLEQWKGLKVDPYCDGFSLGEERE